MHFRWCWGLGTPNPPFVLFGPENGLFKLPKHYVLKGKWPILKQKYCKTGEKPPKGQMVLISRVYGEGVKTYRAPEGGTRPESCPWNGWMFLEFKLRIFCGISVERGQIWGPLKIQNFHPPSNFRRFDPPPYDPGLPSAAEILH